MAWTIAVPLLTDRYAVVVTSGSMAPKIQKGDIVLLAPTDGDEELAPPTVIHFPTPSGDTLHRVHDVKPDGMIETKGDNNSAPDTTLVDPDDVKGVGKLLMPRLALPIAWAREGSWALVAAWIVGATAATWAARWGVSDRYDPWLLADEHRHHDEEIDLALPLPEDVWA